MRKFIIARFCAHYNRSYVKYSRDSKAINIDVFYKDTVIFLSTFESRHLDYFFVLWIT